MFSRDRGFRTRWAAVPPRCCLSYDEARSDLVRGAAAHELAGGLGDSWWRWRLGRLRES